MFSRIRFDRKFIFGVVATFIAALSLTMAPAARAVNAVPDAMPTGTETLLYSFGVGPTPDKCKGKDGANPKGSLTYAPTTGLLLGRTSTTTAKGPGFGTIFQLMPNGSSYVVDNYFAGAKTDGADPENSAMTLVGDVLYGMTSLGGKGDNGAIFTFDTSTSTYTRVYSFDGNHGSHPHGQLILD